MAKREGPAWTRLSQQGKTRLTGCSTALIHCQASSWPQTGFISLCLQQVRCTEGCARAQRALESMLCRTAFPTASYRQSFFCLKGWFWGPPYGLRGRRHRQLRPPFGGSAGLNLSSPPSHFHPVFLHHSWEHPSHTRFLAAQPPKSNCSKQHKAMGIHLPLPTPLTSLPSDQFLDPPHSLE